MKVIERIFEKRLRNVLKLHEMQMGFMPGRELLMQFLYYGRCWKNIKRREGNCMVI